MYTKISKFFVKHIRIPNTLYQRVKKYADNEGLSGNAAIMQLLKIALEQLGL